MSHQGQVWFQRYYLFRVNGYPKRNGKGPHEYCATIVRRAERINLLLILLEDIQPNMIQFWLVQ